jgi:hypothetical protein
MMTDEDIQSEFGWNDKMIFPFSIPQTVLTPGATSTRVDTHADCTSAIETAKKTMGARIA